MPSATLLLWGVLFSSIGIGYAVYGRRQKHKVFFYTGLALMFYPYFLSNLIALITVGCVLLLVPRFVQL